MKVVRRHDSLSRGSCQKLLLASNLEKTLLLLSLARLLSSEDFSVYILVECNKFDTDAGRLVWLEHWEHTIAPLRWLGDWRDYSLLDRLV